MPDSMRSGMWSSIAKRLRDSRYVFLGLTVTLAVITAAYYVILRGRELDPALVNNQILLFFLRNVNFVLVTALAGVLVRNLTKLWFEYRGRRLGAKLKTKLVVTYIGLSLIPVVLLFTIANEVVQGSLDSVFRTEETDLLEPGLRVSQALYSEIERRNWIDAERILELAARRDLTDTANQPELDELLKQRLADFELDVIYAYLDTDFVHAVISPTAGLAELPDVDSGLLLAALRERRASQVQRLDGGERRLLLGAAAEDTGGGDARAVIVAGSVLSRELSAHTQALVEAWQTDSQVRVQEPEIRAVQTLTFLMVTLVLLLMCSWVGLYLARQVTVPIQALAEGTRRIAGGDLDHRVEAPADDELGVLVDSFNRMTAELQRSNSELLESNNALERARQRIDTVLRSVAAGVISIDAAGVISTCNDAAGRMLRIDPGELEGIHIEEARRRHGELAVLVPDDEQTRAEHRVAVGDTWKTFEVSTTPLHSGGRADGRVIVLEDLTELIRAQKLATWNEAARRIAHEIKNPLTPIKLSAERLLRKHRNNDPTFGETLEKSVEIIRREVDKMQTLVDEFARFARMPQPSPQRTDIGEICRDVVHLYGNIRDDLDVVALTSVADDDSPELIAAVDPEQFRRALINLIDNAVEATEGAGTVLVRAQRSNGHLRIQVADQGRGVPAEAKERLFLPYYSTKGRGTGLGLSIVHRIVTDHHGTIRVDDNEPRGTVFTIELPS